MFRNLNMIMEGGTCILDEVQQNFRTKYCSNNHHLVVSSRFGSLKSSKVCFK
jgi:hypothetical protein